MKRLIIFTLCLALLLPVSACQGGEETRVYTLNGTTGCGMAPLICDAKEIDAKGDYAFTVLDDPLEVRDAVINGTADIAAVPTNVASALFNATNGGVKVLALNTGGVLHLVTTEKHVNSFAALAATQTLFVPAQTPAFIMNAILEKVAVQNFMLDSTTYQKPADLRDALVNGLVKNAILPEPLASTAVQKTAASASPARAVLDLTELWEKYYEKGSLVQGCVVVRTEYLEKNPEKVALFLEEYEKSIRYVKKNTDDAAEMIVEANIIDDVAIAKAALPKCNLMFVTGEPMKTALSAFLATMPPKSIGGTLPSDDFYFIPS